MGFDSSWDFLITPCFGLPGPMVFMYLGALFSKTRNSYYIRIKKLDFKTILIFWEILQIMLLNVSITYFQLHIYIWFFIDGRFEYRDVHIKCHCCINKCVCISDLHLSTLSGRFRVGFSAGHEEHICSDGPWIFEL